MRRMQTVFSVLLSALLAWLIGVSSVAMLYTAFPFPSASLGLWLVLSCLLTLGAAISGVWKYGWIGVVGGGTALSAFMLLYTQTIPQALAVAERLSVEYYHIYGWDYLDFPSVDSETLAVVQPFFLLATLFGMLIAYGTMRGWNPLIATVSALPLIPCLIVTSTPPAATAVFVWLTALLTLLLSVSGYAKRPRPAVPRTAATAGVLLVVMGLLFTLIPADRKYNEKYEWRDRTLQVLGLSPEEENPHVRYQLNPTVELSEASAPRGTQMIMKILASRDKVVYVREQDYNVYTGIQWNTETQRYDDLRYGRDADWYLTVQTPEVYAKKFFPYYPAQRASLDGGHQVNNRRETEYTFKVADLPEDWKERVNDLPPVTTDDIGDTFEMFDYTGRGQSEFEDGFIMYPLYLGNDLIVMSSVEADPYEYASYLTLPEETKAWATAYVNDLLTDEVTYTQKADTIAAFVQNSAAYDRRASFAVEEGEDFVKKFLEEENEGCCVHFASATAVLLRAAGVPTRYVTGYTHWANRATWTAITEQNAHAWVEYYEPRMNRWIMLESTPVRFEPQVEETTTTEESTVTTVTTPVDESTAPTKAHDEEPSWMLILPWREIGITASGVCAVVVVMIVQRAIRLAVRRRRRYRGTSNEQTIALWHEIQRLARADKTAPCEAARELSQKAKFSQHSITPEELAVMTAECDRLIARLRKKRWLSRLWDRTIRALY